MALNSGAIEMLLAGDTRAASIAVGAALSPDLALRSETLLRLRLTDLRNVPQAEPWLLRVVTLRIPGRPMIGLAGFHGPPDNAGAVEVGYEIDESHRRQGYGSEAAAGLVAWALRHGGARRVLAAIRRDNHASLAVVNRLGFTSAGSRWDVLDGIALLFECHIPPDAPPRAAGHLNGSVEDRMDDRAAELAARAASDPDLWERLHRIYREAGTIAVVGASHRPDRPAHRIPAYLQSQGFRIIPVNPAGGELFGEQVRKSLAEIDEPIDVVDVFRRAEETPDIARQAVAVGARVLWLQLGIENDEAQAIAEAGGLTVVMNRCMGVTHRWLGLGPGPD